MASVLERTELEASPLADLHAIADQLGLDGFRRLRKADLIDTILGEQTSDDAPKDDAPEEDSESSARSRPRRRGGRSRRSASSRSDAADGETQSDEAEKAEKADGGDDAPEAPRAKRRGRTRAERASAKDSEPRDAGDATEDEEQDSAPKSASGSDAPAGRSPRGRTSKAAKGADEAESGELAEGVVEVLGNGSAFLRIDPPEPSDGDVYISAAQVRRCELVSGDKVAGPVRTPRRSERYPSLVRIDTINGASADEVSAGTRFEDLPVDYPAERFALESKDATLQAIEWLTPFGRGSRVLIVGAARAGKTETLRGLARRALGEQGPRGLTRARRRAPRGDLKLAAGRARARRGAELRRLCRHAGPGPRARDRRRKARRRARRSRGRADRRSRRVAAARARKTLAAARNLREGGSLTIVATATQPFGGESTVIALDVALTSTGAQPILDLAASGTLKPELLVGKDGAKAIAKARASALEG